MKDPASKLLKGNANAKSDVANKLISMFLHELSRSISALDASFGSSNAEIKHSSPLQFQEISQLNPDLGPEINPLVDFRLVERKAVGAGRVNDLINRFAQK